MNQKPNYEQQMVEEMQKK